MCPTFQVPVGTGLLIAGGNGNIVEGNYIFDNWRRGTMLHWVPASCAASRTRRRHLRHVHNNAYATTAWASGHRHLTRARLLLGAHGHRGTRTAIDFWWDEEEGQDCDPTSRAASTPRP